MPHSLRVKLSGLRYKGILEDKDYKRLCHALDLEKAEQDNICDTCKHNDKEWDEEPCDGCCGNHSGFEPKSPCDLCRYNPPSSSDGKPCTMCPAEGSDE